MADRFLQPGQHIQREDRTVNEYTDQFGRTFTAVAEISTAAPIGEMRPINCNPPWLPSQPYAVFTRGSLSFRWDHKRLIEELGAMSASYYDEAVKAALEKNLPVPELGGVVDRRIKALLGPPPFSPAIPLAVEAGDRWLQGWADATPTPELEAIVKHTMQVSGVEFVKQLKHRMEQVLGRVIVAEPDPVIVVPVEEDVPVTYAEFYKAARKEGKTNAEAVALWKEHKALMAEPVPA